MSEEENKYTQDQSYNERTVLHDWWKTVKSELGRLFSLAREHRDEIAAFPIRKMGETGAVINDTQERTYDENGKIIGGNRADGAYSLAGGTCSEALGAASVALGTHTVAAGENQLVSGKYNAEDADALQIVGNGTKASDGTVEYSNAYTLDKDGNGWFAGEVTVGAEKERLMTEQEVKNALETKADITLKIADADFESTGSEVRLDECIEAGLYKVWCVANKYFVGINTEQSYHWEVDEATMYVFVSVQETDDTLHHCAGYPKQIQQVCIGAENDRLKMRTGKKASEDAEVVWEDWVSLDSLVTSIAEMDSEINEMNKGLTYFAENYLSIMRFENEKAEIEEKFEALEQQSEKVVTTDTEQEIEGFKYFTKGMQTGNISSYNAGLTINGALDLELKGSDSVTLESKDICFKIPRDGDEEEILLHAKELANLAKSTGEFETVTKERLTALESKPDAQAETVPYDNTESGLEAENLQSAIDELTEKLGGIGNIAVESWADVQKIVRMGLAPKVFRIGDQFTVAKGDENLVFDIIGFDHDTPVDTQYTHSMTLQMHDCYKKMSFDESEALYDCKEELLAGTYCFTLPSGYDEECGGGKSYSFTTTKAVPQGGQVYFRWAIGTQASAGNITTRQDAASATVIETVCVTEGTDGTFLGTADGKSENMNHIQRARYGYNNWEESSVRQYLNSDKGANEWWQPMNVFDKKSSYDSYPGFLNGMDTDFVSVLGKVYKRTALNSITDGGGFKDSEELIFLPSITEVYGGGSFNTNIDEGQPYAYYKDFSDHAQPTRDADSNRIKYYENSPQRPMLRSCYTGGVYNNLYIHTTGKITDGYSCNGYLIAPACCIV